MSNPDANKPSFNSADDRTPAERERRLLDSAHAEGRESGTGDERPLSEAHHGKPARKAEGGLRHILNTGLPPGIDPDDAIDPGTRNLADHNKADNRS